MIRFFRHILGLLALLLFVPATAMACDDEDLNSLAGEYFLQTHLEGTKERLPATPFSNRLMTSNDKKFLKAEYERLVAHLKDLSADRDYFSARELAYIRKALNKKNEVILSDLETWQAYRNLVSQTALILKLALDRSEGIEYELKKCCAARCPDCRFNYPALMDHRARRRNPDSIPPAITERGPIETTEADGRRVLLYQPEAS